MRKEKGKMREKHKKNDIPQHWWMEIWIWILIGFLFSRLLSTPFLYTLICLYTKNNKKHNKHNKQKNKTEQRDSEPLSPNNRALTYSIIISWYILYTATITQQQLNVFSNHHKYLLYLNYIVSYYIVSPLVITSHSIII